MAKLADTSLNDLLAQVAAATPAPGGGCSIGWTCALAAGLAEMAAGITIARGTAGPELAQARTRAARLRQLAVQLAERELRAYEPVLEAMRLPEAATERSERVAAALSEAAQTPLELARCGAEITALAAELASASTLHVQGDAIAGVLLAEGATQAAARLTRINLAAHPDDERLAQLDELTNRSATARAQALSGARS